MRKVVNVTVLGNYQLGLTFDDGKKGVVDVSHLVNRGVFSCWQDREFFGQVQIGTSGELLWGDQVDLCPDALYLKMTGVGVEELFPTTRDDLIHA